MTWVNWAGLIAYGAGWFVIGVLFGRRLMYREMDRVIDTANLIHQQLWDTEEMLRQARDDRP
ncbi:MAG TPA: hypothetical protein VFB74_30585 [Kribbellaceae bacterium]|nr:hypothetical protein [Kribbellaceae bacterium]